MAFRPLFKKMFYRNVTVSLKFLFACSFLLQYSLAGETEDAEAGEIVSTYKNTENAIIKRKALRKLSQNTRETGEAVAQWKKDLISEALSEEDPTVVEAAVHQVTALALPEFNQRLIYLYHNAPDLFANMYDSRVRVSIVRALGKTGVADNSAFTLFQDILIPEKDKFTYVQGDVLMAIKQCNDPGFIPMVQKYGDFMKAAVAEKKAAGEDPVFYRILEDYSSMCDDIIRALKKQERR